MKIVLDNNVIIAAFAAKADYLVTGDQDLLILKKMKGIPIVLPRTFWERLNQK